MSRHLGNGLRDKVYSQVNPKKEHKWFPDKVGNKIVLGYLKKFLGDTKHKYFDSLFGKFLLDREDKLHFPYYWYILVGKNDKFHLHHP